MTTNGSQQITQKLHAGSMHDDGLSYGDYVEQLLKRAQRLRQAILRRTFAGKLVPQDPTDEPATALLDRIRAERRAQPPAVRARRGRAGGQGRMVTVSSE